MNGFVDNLDLSWGAKPPAPASEADAVEMLVHGWDTRTSTTFLTDSAIAFRNPLLKTLLPSLVFLRSHSGVCSRSFTLASRPFQRRIGHHQPTSLFRPELTTISSLTGIVKRALSDSNSSPYWLLGKPKSRAFWGHGLVSLEGFLLLSCSLRILSTISSLTRLVEQGSNGCSISVVKCCWRSASFATTSQ